MTGRAAPPDSGELHRPIPLAQIGPAGTERDIAATPQECEAIAARLRLPAVASLSCRFRLSAIGAGVVVAAGSLAARVTQECIVTAEPFEAEIREAFRVRFVPEEQFDDSDDAPIDLDADDELPYRGGHVDLGEATVQQLALALDPYPRAPGAALPAIEGQEPDDDATQAPRSPFAALARRRKPG
jgi:uncharacterized metal-binding protein YceD (DUF177 family)